MIPGANWVGGQPVRPGNSEPVHCKPWSHDGLASEDSIETVCMRVLLSRYRTIADMVRNRIKGVELCRSLIDSINKDMKGVRDRLACLKANNSDNGNDAAISRCENQLSDLQGRLTRETQTSQESTFLLQQENQLLQDCMQSLKTLKDKIDRTNNDLLK